MAVAAPGYSNECLLYLTGKKFAKHRSFNKSRKPDVGMMEFVLNDMSLIFSKSAKEQRIWIVGDRHNNKFPEDWQFAQNCQKKFAPTFIFVPIESFDLALLIAEKLC
jgi:histidinol phosphatase-like enzyme